MDSSIHFFARIHDVPSEFLELHSEREASKVRIHGADIYVRNNESPVHKVAVSGIMTDIDNSTYPSRSGYVLSPNGSIILVNKFLCGMLVKKIPDALFQSLMESVHLLTEYSTIEYSIAVKIFQHSDNNRFHALLHGKLN